MDEGRASRTAIATAYFRAHHYEHANPKIFEDSLAGALLRVQEREGLEKFFLERLANAQPGTRPIRRRPCHPGRLCSPRPGRRPGPGALHGGSAGRGDARRGLTVCRHRGRARHVRPAPARSAGSSAHHRDRPPRNPGIQARADRRRRADAAAESPFRPGRPREGKHCRGPVADALRSVTTGLLLLAGRHHVPDGRCDPGDTALPAECGRTPAASWCSTIWTVPSSRPKTSRRPAAASSKSSGVSGSP